VHVPTVFGREQDDPTASEPAVVAPGREAQSEEAVAGDQSSPT
jgi:hypothetical protein